MSEGRLWLMLEVLGLLSLTAVLFGLFGWWLRSKFMHETASRVAALELSRAKEKIRKLETVVSDGQCALARCEAERDDLRKGATVPPDTAEIEDLHKNLSLERRRLVELEAELRSARAQLAEHAAAPAPVTLAPQSSAALDEAQAEIADLRQQLAAAQSQPPPAVKTEAPTPTASADQQQAVTEAQSALAAAEAQTGHLRKELDLALGEIKRLKAEHTAPAAAPVQQELLPLGLASTATDHTSAELALLKKNLDASVPYRTGEKPADDLTRIKGVAKVLNARLNAYGVFSFQQIVDWSSADIDTFGRLMGFKDRVKREDWQGQCRKFLADATK